MLNRTLHIELLSDLCSASGDGFAGVVDTDICYEDNGRPYIPGKRIKGCLRECGLDILSVDNSYEADFSRLFGSIGVVKISCPKQTQGNLPNCYQYTLW